MNPNVSYAIVQYQTKSKGSVGIPVPLERLEQRLKWYAARKIEATATYRGEEIGRVEQVDVGADSPDGVFWYVQLFDNAPIPSK